MQHGDQIPSYHNESDSDEGDSNVDKFTRVCIKDYIH